MSACRKVSSKQRIIVGPSQLPFRAPSRRGCLFDSFMYVCVCVRVWVYMFVYSTRKGGLYLIFIQRIASAPLAQSEPISTALPISKASKRIATIVSSPRFWTIQALEARTRRLIRYQVQSSRFSHLIYPKTFF